jgi:CO/xanthine dehydrogenase Mo-binding subunit
MLGPERLPADRQRALIERPRPRKVALLGAEVEVTGHVRIAKLVNICDIGKPINPKICESQISGAAMMQLGFTMFERCSSTAAR